MAFGYHVTKGHAICFDLTDTAHCGLQGLRLHTLPFQALCALQASMALCQSSVLPCRWQRLRLRSRSGQLNWQSRPRPWLLSHEKQPWPGGGASRWGRVGSAIDGNALVLCMLRPEKQPQRSGSTAFNLRLKHHLLCRPFLP